MEIINEYNSDSPLIIFNGLVEEFIGQIPDNSIDLIVSSPPYNIGKEYESKLEIDDYLEKQEEVIENLVKKISDTGSICWQVGNYVREGEVFPLDIFFYELFKKRGLKLRNRIIWRFGHGLHASNRFSGRYETVLWFTKTEDYKFNLDPVRIPSKYPGKKHSKGPKKGEFSGNPKGKNPSNFWEFLRKEWENSVWEIPNVKANHKEKTIHPCQFPIELVERCILAFTDENDTILDPYMGVGSSLIAAIKNNRKAIGIEKEEKYIEVTKERIQQFSKDDLKIRKLGKPVYKPQNESVAKIPEEWLEDESTIYYNT